MMEKRTRWFFIVQRRIKVHRINKKLYTEQPFGIKLFIIWVRALLFILFQFFFGSFFLPFFEFPDTASHPTH